MEVPERGIMVASFPSLQLQAEGLVAELWCPGLVQEYSNLRCFHVTAAKQ